MEVPQQYAWHYGSCGRALVPRQCPRCWEYGCIPLECVLREEGPKCMAVCGRSEQVVGGQEGSRGTGEGSAGEKRSQKLWRQQYNGCTQAESERAMCQQGCMGKSLDWERMGSPRKFSNIPSDWKL
ncbi:EH domain-binding protein 1 [Platysternon megacephalum]|uniref:EH domain-binding protein 1 n=1 Tax=Platysternon megacephalum TaxID=55544 RepID=A0A4D9E772_9SAUR|nr:EH domain-binding protein 1 [Platysternon megacephalum]